MEPVSFDLAMMIAAIGAIVGVGLYVVARLGAAGRWGSDQKVGDLGPGGAYRSARAVEVVHRAPPLGARVLAAISLVVGAIAVALAGSLELLVIQHRMIATDPLSTRPWLHPSVFDLVVAGAVAICGAVDGFIAATGWSVVRRSILRRRSGYVFVAATLAHVLVAWAIGARPAPYTPWAILYELVGMACVVVGWMLAISKSN